MQQGAKGKSLWQYALERLLQAVPLILGVLIVNFLLINLAPGDPITALVGDFPVPDEYIERIREQYGLDQPLPVRLFQYITNVLRGDLGFSFRYRVPVLELVLERLGRTIILMISTIVFATIVGVSLGIVAAKKPHSFVDSIATGIAITGYAVPVFWLGQILILLFAVQLNWFPAGGMRSTRIAYEGLAYYWDLARHMILPMLALSFRYVALTTRLSRSTLMEVLNSEYILAARIRGVSEKKILWNHGLKAAALPILTVIGFHFTFIVAGSALVETVFGWPGIGRLMYDSIFARDYPTLLGILLAVSIVVILVNLITDIAYAFLDPRVRYN